MTLNSFFFAAAVLFLFSFSHATVVINEVVSSNGTTIADEDGDYEDWIELFNSSTEAVQLEGFSLSDNISNLKKWTFPPYLMKPQEYLIVFTSGKDRSPGKYFHTSFSISADGEPLILTSSVGDTLDIIDSVPIPRDVSYGRTAAGTLSFFSQPTPGAKNGENELSQVVPPPMFSHKSGYYNAPFACVLTCQDAGAVVYYTVDGSEPDPKNVTGTEYQYKTGYQTQNGVLTKRTFTTMRYAAPIEVKERTLDGSPLHAIQTSFDTASFLPPKPVFKGVTIRAVAVKEGALPSKVQTCTYLVDSEKTHRYPVPVVSIAVPETSLFKYEGGIYVPGKIYDDSSGSSRRFNEIGMANPAANYTQRGDEWEREANFELINTLGEPLLNQIVGLRIHGGWTRAAPNKTLRVYARNRYGDNSFNHQFFASKDTKKFRNILLRNGGNDFNSTLFRDALIHKLVSSQKIDKQESCPSVVLVNGEYWGIANIRDRLDKYYLEGQYKLDPDSVDVLAVNMMSRGVEVVEGDATHYTAMLDYIKSNNVTDSAVYAKVGTLMDIENFILYQAIEIYSRNTDWPQNNSEWWRYKTAAYNPQAPYGLDGRWRWMLFDLDFGFGIWENTADHNTLEYAACATGRSCQTWSTVLFSTLLKNTTFRNATINQFADLMNTSFKLENVVAEIDVMKKTYAPLMDEHINRWREPESSGEWEKKIDTMLIFTKARKGYMVKHLKDFFTLEDTVQISVGVAEGNGGAVKLNTITISESQWTGMYFKGVPVNVQAVPAKGFKFSHWTGVADSTLPLVRLVPVKSMNLIAHFAVDPLSVAPPKIRYTHQIISDVSVFNSKGQRVALLTGTFMGSGTVIKSLKQRKLPGGVYYVRMGGEKSVVTHRVTLF